MIKNKLFFLSLICLFFHKNIERFFLIKKIAHKTQNITPKKEENIKYDEKNYLLAEVIDNRWTTLVINKGKKDNLKLNMMVKGATGFIGIIQEIGENYSIIKTFWNTNWHLILVDGLNNYGILNNHGYFLTLKTSQISHNTKIYIIGISGIILLGYTKKIGKFLTVIPEENLVSLSTVLIKK
jgi:cell shape-determining protein MreC